MLAVLSEQVDDPEGDWDGKLHYPLIFIKTARDVEFDYQRRAYCIRLSEGRLTGEDMTQSRTSPPDPSPSELASASSESQRYRKAMEVASHNHLRLIMRSRPTGYLPPIENAGQSC